MQLQQPLELCMEPYMLPAAGAVLAPVQAIHSLQARKSRHSILQRLLLHNMLRVLLIASQR